MRELISRAEAKAKGLTRYFTGKPCKYGHIEERVTSNLTCLECDRLSSKERNRQYRAKNPDKNKEAVRQYRTKHPDKIKERDKRHRAKKFSAKLTAQIETGKSSPHLLSEFDAMDIFKATSTDTFVWDTGVKE